MPVKFSNAFEVFNTPIPRIKEDVFRREHSLFSSIQRIQKVVVLCFIVTLLVVHPIVDWYDFFKVGPRNYSPLSSTLSKNAVCWYHEHDGSDSGGGGTIQAGNA